MFFGERAPRAAPDTSLLALLLALLYCQDLNVFGGELLAQHVRPSLYVVLRGRVHAQTTEGLAPGIRGYIHDVSALSVVRTAEVF
jgi:hypothetical protein